MAERNDYSKFLEYANQSILNKEKTISQLTAEFDRKFGENIGEVAFASRLKRYRKKVRKAFSKPEPIKNVEASKEYEEINENGEISALKIVKYSAAIFGDKAKLLDYLGYDHEKWNLKKLRSSVYQQRSKKDGTYDLYAVQFTVEPKCSVEPEEYVSAIKELIENGIEPYTPPECREMMGGQSDDRLMEIAPIELHLGKLAHSGETGQDYDLHIAEKKFYDIIDEIVARQQEEKCGKCLLVIGSDFFNSESDNMTTGKTPQQNDTRYKKLMQEGFTMYVNAIKRLSIYFQNIDVLLCSGNHARAMEFFLYFALQQYFRNEGSINFREDYKDTQAYKFGNCAIFFNHGDGNLKRTIASIPSEFYEIWGKTLYRELHLGHLHKEVTVDDEGGMITRRIGSPCGTDAWHYQNRFVGAVQKHEIFIWDKKTGLKSIHYINTQYV